MHAAIKNHMENTCFICGLDRFTLDTSGPGFDHHVKHEHNMWAYLQLIIYLKQKDPTELNGWEQHVAAKVAQQDASFFPRNRALSVAGGEAGGCGAAQAAGRDAAPHG
jgi:inositol 1,4,5-triphosphate receptor type 1